MIYDPIAQFVWLGFHSVKCLDFRLHIGDQANLVAAIEAVGGPRNRFDPARLVGALDELVPHADRYEFGREGSPVLYVYLPAWYPGRQSGETYHATTPDERVEHAQAVLDWGERMRADERTVRQDAPVGVDPDITRNPGENPRVVRLWWD